MEKYSQAVVSILYTIRRGDLKSLLGSDGVKFWNIQSQKKVGCSDTNHDLRGTVTCAVWIKPKSSAAELLCYGTGLGYIALLRPDIDVSVCQRERIHTSPADGN